MAGRRVIEVVKEAVSHQGDHAYIDAEVIDGMVPIGITEEDALLSLADLVTRVVESRKGDPSVYGGDALSFIQGFTSALIVARKGCK